MMTKTRLTGGSVLVTFELTAAAAAAAVSVCGDFNDWSPTSHQLTRTDNGSFQATLELPAGRRWRFRYLLDGQRWENDWAADDYLPNGHGGDDSVVDLTDTSALPLTPVRLRRPRRERPPPQGPGPAGEPATTARRNRRVPEGPRARARPARRRTARRRRVPGRPPRRRRRRRPADHQPPGRSPPLPSSRRTRLPFEQACAQCLLVALTSRAVPTEPCRTQARRWPARSRQ